MTHNEFEKVLVEMQNYNKEILSSKATEYATDSDRLHNFKRSAAILRSSPEKALVGFLIKHITSVIDMCDDPEKHDLTTWREKIGDSINYLHLLHGLVYEGRVNQLEESK